MDTIKTKITALKTKIAGIGERLAILLYSASGASYFFYELCVGWSLNLKE